MNHVQKTPLKYVGGKARLYDKIKPYFLSSKKQAIAEPFAGAAATFFLLSKEGLLTEPSLLNDLSSPLIDFYEELKTNPLELSSALTQFSDYHSERFYYHVREWDRYDQCTSQQLAARYYYINRIGYNGLYRVNGDNQCNTPWGQRKSFNVNQQNLNWASKTLQGAVLDSAQYDSLPITNDKFYLIDPPYYDTFDGYTNTRADKAFYERLKAFIDALNAIGAPFLLTNSNNTFIQELFSEYRQQVVNITYSVSGKVSGRKPTTELFISNIEINHDN